MNAYRWILITMLISASAFDLPLSTQSSISNQTQPARATSSTDSAQMFINALRISTKTPAISAAVAKDGKIIFSYGSGMIDVKNQTLANGKSVYNIGSLSKTITAVAVMELMEQKRISLDDDIKKYVLSFPDKGAKITIRHLLTHTSGIRHYHPNDFPGTPDNENVQPISWQEGLRIFENDPLLFLPGKYFFYSSYGVNLLTGVVEKSSGLSFEQYIKRNVFELAGMTTASFDIPESTAPNRATSYRIVTGRPIEYYYNDLRYKFASGGMIASTEDLVKFGAAINHGTLMRPETRKIMFSSQLHGVREFREGASPVRMSWMQGILWRLRYDAKGRFVVYECGSVKGSNACLVDFVNEDLVAAIATNSWECCGWSKADSLAAFFRD